MIDSLRVAVARYVLGDLDSDSLPAVALEALAAGASSMDLAALAGAVRADTPAELRAMFESSLRELGVTQPSRLQAAFFLRYEYSRQVVEGRLAPDAGATEIVNVYRQVEGELPRHGYVGEEFGIAELVGAYYDLFEHPAANVELEQSIRELCAVILQEGPPPPWWRREPRDAG